MSWFPQFFSIFEMCFPSFPSLTRSKAINGDSHRYDSTYHSANRPTSSCSCRALTLHLIGDIDHLNLKIFYILGNIRKLINLKLENWKQFLLVAPTTVKTNKKSRLIYFFKLWCFFMITYIIMIGVKQSEKFCYFKFFVSFIDSSFHWIIFNKVDNEFGILKLLECKEIFQSQTSLLNLISFLYRCTKRMKTVLAVWYWMRIHWSYWLVTRSVILRWMAASNQLSPQKKLC